MCQSTTMDASTEQPRKNPILNILRPFHFYTERQDSLSSRLMASRCTTLPEEWTWTSAWKYHETHETEITIHLVCHIRYGWYTDSCERTELFDEVSLICVRLIKFKNGKYAAQINQFGIRIRDRHRRRKFNRYFFLGRTPSGGDTFGTLLSGENLKFWGIVRCCEM